MEFTLTRITITVSHSHGCNYYKLYFALKNFKELKVLLKKVLWLCKSGRRNNFDGKQGDENSLQFQNYTNDKTLND